MLTSEKRDFPDFGNMREITITHSGSLMEQIAHQSYNTKEVSEFANRILNSTQLSSMVYLKNQDEIFMQKALNNMAGAGQPPPCEYVLSLYPVYRQLQQTLRRLDNYSDEFAACVLHGCAMYVLNMNRTWVETPPLDDLYTRVSLGANISMEEAAKLCRDLDTDIGAIVFHHLPELGRPDLLELKNYEFIHDHDLKLELQYRIPLLPAPDASSAPVRDPGAGLPGSV
jgi:hypothetical protein